MNTTMADGAEQRLDAQIAEALFGQPGMSKMDVANRVRELRGDGPVLLVGEQPGGMVRLGDRAARERFEAWPQAREFEIQKDGSGEYLSEVTQGAWLAWQHLSAQPSPGGQGDARAALIEEAIGCLDLIAAQPPLVDQARRALVRALAARQPVGEPVDDDWHLRGYAYASKQATNCAGCGKRKHTPLRIDAMGGHVCLTCIDHKLGALLGEFGYPPAQAVDLGRLPRAVVLLSNVSRSLVDWAAEDQLEAIGIINALIDGKAVGNG